MGQPTDPDLRESKPDPREHGPALERALARLPLSAPQPCHYLEGETTRLRGVDGEAVPLGLYASFLHIGWRRSGTVLYQPRCPSCQACIPIRVPISGFQPNRSQRRALKRNLDLSVTVAPPTVSDERSALYQRYVTACHEGPMTGERDELTSFLVNSPVDTVELEVRDSDLRLLAVMTIDRTHAGWNCVYCYYDPDQSTRSLGTYSIVRAIELCARHCPAGDQSYLYLGYWVPGSKTMAYKANFRPHELRTPAGGWVRVE